MQTSAATLENGMEVPQKLKIELPYNPAIALLGICLKNTKTLIQRVTGILMFISGIIYNRKIMEPYTSYIIYMGVCVCVILLSHKKEWNLVICSDVDGTREDNAKWGKSIREGQIPYESTHMWNLRNKTNEYRGKMREANQETDS